MKMIFRQNGFNFGQQLMGKAGPLSTFLLQLMQLFTRLHFSKDRQEQLQRTILMALLARFVELNQARLDSYHF